MRPMPTELLKLRRGADGYFRTSWTDQSGKPRQRSFGKEKKLAANRFAAFHARWRTDRAVRNPDERGAKTLQEVFALFEIHATAYYRRPDGTPTGEAATIRQAMDPMLDLFGDCKIESIDVQHLKRAREQLIRNALAVSTINAYVRKVRQVWRWFANEQHASASVWHGMAALTPLRPGRGLEIDGRPIQPHVTEPVRPVPDDHVYAVCNELPLTLRSMVMLQFLTGARSTEVCRMRPIDIETGGKIWFYTPERHKTQHHGKARMIAIGPRAQEWLVPLLAATGGTHGFIFSPRKVWAERMALRRAAYQPPASKGDYRRWRRVTGRESSPRGGEVFDRTTYARAVARACADAEVPHWHPNQLRHSAATRMRKEFGIEVAQAVLGHSRVQTTELYAQLGMEKAIAAMEAVG